MSALQNPLKVRGMLSQVYFFENICPDQNRRGTAVLDQTFCNRLWRCSRSKLDYDIHIPRSVQAGKVLKINLEAVTNLPSLDLWMIIETQASIILDGRIVKTSTVIILSMGN